MFRMPWITLAAAVLICISPLGQEVYRSLYSGEGLSRAMAHAFLLIYAPLAALVVLAEIGIRILILRRRRNRANAETAETET